MACEATSQPVIGRTYASSGMGFPRTCPENLPKYPKSPSGLRRTSPWPRRRPQWSATKGKQSGPRMRVSPLPPVLGRVGRTHVLIGPHQEAIVHVSLHQACLAHVYSLPSITTLTSTRCPLMLPGLPHPLQGPERGREANRISTTKGSARASVPDPSRQSKAPDAATILSYSNASVRPRSSAPGADPPSESPGPGAAWERAGKRTQRRRPGR